MVFLEVDLRYPYSIGQKTKHFPFCPENKSISQDIFFDCMRRNNPKNHISQKKLICDWTDKKKYLIYYRIIKFYVRHGIVTHKVDEIISFKWSKWLEKCISFNTRKRNQAVNVFEKDFYKLLKNALFGKTKKNVRNICTIDFIYKKMKLTKLWNNNLS